MKLNRILPLALSVIVAHSYAIERPAGESPSVDDIVITGKNVKPLPKVGTVKFGVVPGVVPQVLLSQLQLNGFPGAVVESVIPDSPAQKIGLQPNDVIVKIGTHPVSGPQDISRILSEYTPGDKVGIEYYSAGQKKTVDMTLEAGSLSAEEILASKAHPSDMSKDEGSSQVPNISPQQLQNNPHARLMQMMGNGNMMGGPSMDDMMADMDAMRQALKDKMAHGMPNMGGMHSMVQSSSVRSDNHGTVVITQSNQAGTHVKVTDREGKVLFDGPYNTDEDKQKASDDVKARLENMGL